MKPELAVSFKMQTSIRVAHLRSTVGSSDFCLIFKFIIFMKKLIFIFVAFVAVSFMSCGNKTASVASTDSTAIDSMDTTTDSVVVDSVSK